MCLWFLLFFMFCYLQLTMKKNVVSLLLPLLILLCSYKVEVEFEKCLDGEHKFFLLLFMLLAILITRALYALHYLP
jgi:hypothetical protein